MKIGLMLGATQGGENTLDGVINTAIRAEDAGFDNVWMANIFGLDAISTLTLAGRETSRIGLGTAVTPTYPRHPQAMAQQAMTAAVASEGRFILGIGLSHKMVIEDMLGMSYDKPARHMREYLSALMPLIAGEQTDFDGDEYRVHVKMDVPEQQKMPVLVAALGPVMLKLAGRVADGTTTWVTGPKTLEQHIIPTISEAAAEAGRPEPKICAGLPIVLTNNPDEAKAVIAKQLVMYGMLPSYRAMLDREGVAGPEDVAMVGDESELRDRLQQLRDIGVSHFNGAVVGYEDGAWERTFEYLQDELQD